MKPILAPSSLFVLLLLLGGCASPTSGRLILGDDDDSVGDDDDSVGDDDDSVGDDDDSVGDDDDSVGDDDDSVGEPSAYAGDWFGGVSLFREGGGGFTLCEEEVFFVVEDGGQFNGEGPCTFGGGGGGGTGYMLFSGFFGADGEMGFATVDMDFGGWFSQSYGIEGGVYEEEGVEYIYTTWLATLPTPQGDLQVTGEAWAVRE